MGKTDWRYGIVVCLLLTSGCLCKHFGAKVSVERHWTFDADKVGAVPRAWRIASSNPEAKTASWRVMEDSSAPSGARVLALTESENHDATYNLALARGTSFRDFELTVRVKAVEGEEDQGGGPVWRYQDADHYYLTRINPLEQNFRVYVVHQGKRRHLDHADVALEAGRWYEIKIRMVGSRIECSLDGQPLLEASDETIPDSGMVGLWTKADAVTSFDDLRVRPMTQAPKE